MLSALLLSIGLLAASDPPAVIAAADEAFVRIDYPTAVTA